MILKPDPRRFAMLLAMLLLGVCAGARAQDLGPLVKEIEIRFIGPATVHKSIIAANTRTVAGAPMSRSVIEQDVRDLIATGYFQDVRVLEESVDGGVKIVFQLQGKAKVKEIVFDGNKKFPDTRLSSDIEFKSGDILDERKVHNAARKIRERYQKAGYPDVRADYRVELDRDTGTAVVWFTIDEGPRVFIKRIDFHGNDSYTDKRLHKLFKTRHRWWGSWLAGTGILRDQEFIEDIEKLRDFYRSNGFLDMEVTDSHTERFNEKYMIVHIKVFEGQRYKVGSIAITGNTLFPTADLERRWRMKTGDTYTPGGLSANLKAIEDYYGARGYLDTSVRVSKVPNVETGQMDLAFAIREGRLTYINLVEIRGNTITKDKVIRRELAVNPGEIYDTVRVDASAERLRNLGYFAKVETFPRPTDVPDQRDMVVTVEEKSTGTLTFGAGFSSIDNLIGFVELTQNNFDLFNAPTFRGGGQKLRTRLQLGFERQDANISFVEPWFLDRKLALGTDLFYNSALYLSDYYEEQRFGGAMSLEKALNEFIRGRIEYRLENIATDVENDASDELKSQDGEALRSAVALRLTRDTRNNVFLTERGNRTELGVEFAGGPWGGDVSVYKLQARTQFYFPMFKQHILMTSLSASVVQAFGDTKDSNEPYNDVPIFDRYFLGGANTLRGFDYRDVGPRDENGEPVGGNTSVYGTIEYTIPVVERIRLALFFDIGQLREESYSFAIDDTHANVGIGVRLNLPIGPLRLDYGYPVWRDPDSGTNGQIQFSAGYQF